MNAWLGDLLEAHLIVAGGVHPGRASDIVESLLRLLEERHMAVVPTFLSDEMFEALRALDAGAIYQEKSRDWSVAVNAYRQLCLTSHGNMLPSHHENTRMSTQCSESQNQ